MKVIHIFMLIFVSHHGLHRHVNINLDLEFSLQLRFHFL